MLKNNILMLLVPAALALGGCVVAPAESSYLVGNELDMSTPVYVAAQPDYVFYHRYDRGCDCVLIVRSVDTGGSVYWVDHTGRRVRDGYWEPMRPSPRAVYGYRQWSHEHRHEFHSQPPRGYQNAPPYNGPTNNRSPGNSNMAPNGPTQGGASPNHDHHTNPPPNGRPQPLVDPQGGRTQQQPGYQPPGRGQQPPGYQPSGRGQQPPGYQPPGRGQQPPGYQPPERTQPSTGHQSPGRTNQQEGAQRPGRPAPSSSTARPPERPRHAPEKKCQEGKRDC